MATERPKTWWRQWMRCRACGELEARVAALSESEERYKHLVELASDWFWETDARGCFTYVSATVERTLGLPVSAYIGRRLADTDGVHFDAAAGRATLEAFRARQPYRDFIYSRKLASGKIVWINASGGPRYHKNGDFLGYGGVARDVTKQVEAERRLRQLEQQYRRLFESALDSYWEMDLRGRVTYISSAFERSTGIPEAELLGRRLNDLPMVKIDPESGARTLEAIKAGKPYDGLRHIITRASGDVIHVGTSGIPMYDENGVLTGYCGVSKDITAEVEAERALRRSEARFRELFEIASDYYWEMDENHRMTYVAPESFHDQLYGVPAARIYGKRLSDYEGVSFSPEVGLKILHALKERKPFRDAFISIVHPNGRKRWISVAASPRYGPDGTFIGYRGTGVEITERIEAEAAARLAQRQLHDAVAHLTQPLAVFDANERAVAFNQAFADLYRTPGHNSPVHNGISFHALTEYQIETGFYTQGPPEEMVDLARLLDDYRLEREYTYHVRDDRWMLVSYRRLPGDGKLGLWTDVTEIKRAEAERRALEVQLHHSQRLEALGTLAGGAAHEINNALVPAISLAKLMAGKQPEGSRERRNLELILAGAERSRDLVKQILAFSRKDTEERAKQNVDVATVLREALQMMRATVPTSIAIIEEIAQTPAILGDPGQLHQVIVNMATNAAQAIGETTGTITVTLRPEPDGAHLRLSIADTGCGMDEATKARIFEPFFTTRQVGEGTGLGLAVVHGIVKDHGGRIEVESAAGKGARFDLVLPIPRAEAASGAAA
jgi:PAS domain S-box-containing protein